MRSLKMLAATLGLMATSLPSEHSVVSSLKETRKENMLNKDYLKRKKKIKAIKKAKRITRQRS